MDDAAPARAHSLDEFLDLACRDSAFAGADADSFLRQFHDDFAQEDIADFSSADLLALAREFWTWGAKTDGVRVRPGAGADHRLVVRDILEIAGPDMPFLVRSVIGEIVDQGLRAIALAHPIVHMAAGARSMIQVHLEPLTQTQANALTEGVRATLADVRAVVGDFATLKTRMRESADELQTAKTHGDPEDVTEAIAFLRWLIDDHFTFLGARDYHYARDAAGAYIQGQPIIQSGTGLGVLRDEARRVLRDADEPSQVTPAIKAFLDDPAPLLVAKSSLRSRVHRRVPADYIGVKRYDSAGNVIGERRFVGLFTADAYNEMTRAIPLLRHKVARVLTGSGATPGGHDYAMLTNILETFPRDELFQIGDLDLLTVSEGVLRLTDRPRPRAFVRRDPFNRYVSALVYLPKEKFNSVLRERVGHLLTQAYGGRVHQFRPLLGEGPLARVEFDIQDIDRTRRDPDFAKLDADIAALTRDWDDDLEALLRARRDVTDETRAAMAFRFHGAFTAAYRERFTPAEALIDIAELESATDADAIRVRAYRLPDDPRDRLRCKIYARGEELPLSSTLPILENLGLFLFAEETLKVTPRDTSGPFWIHDIDMRVAAGPCDFASIKAPFEEAVAAVWSGRAESDGFNKLILILATGWREAALLRALARWRGQTGLDPLQTMQEQALADNPEIARHILALFHVRFDIAAPASPSLRQRECTRIEAAISSALEQVMSLDADRILRRIAALVGAIQRTNYFQRDANGAAKPYISFKIASGALADVPDPKPFREIWVWSPEVEGVHLRFGPIARGGIRWTDRPTDFRAEILDLVKAQNLKNSIIVPVGAKGGFFPKRPGKDPATIHANGIAAYQTFLRGLLDLTDNVVDGKVVPPKDVVIWDGEDPYLVVAADKGTATFSDIANQLADDYGFWLSDAFASGGSVGYDHKAMGITARGAWEAVKRHFREIGTDIQRTPFTVIGVGDMSGDVFGNGMLLSKQIKLLAAFDHRDVFIDPAPADLEAAWTERERLFDKPGSRWKDYDPKLISKGGGIFSRQDKSIQLSPEIQALTGLTQTNATPAELVHALLTAEVELLWFGGIGTFIKAAREAHADAADKANDALRADAEDVRALVIGEGANLGVTQAGRIAYARKGGRLNADSIDNSAGVDTSDHEVNIKILLTEAMRTGALAPDKRVPLLAAMTGEVATHVLRHNYEQTLALTLSQATAPADLDAHERFMLRLEQDGQLNRRVETLPTTAQIADLRARGLGLTRPELTKIIAYAKLALSHTLVDSAAPDDAAFEAALIGYFPRQLAPYEPQMRNHRLRREIIATTLADDLVNLGGPTFVERARDTAQASAPAIAIAFSAARTIFAIDAIHAQINALDNQAPAAAQTALHLEVAAALRRATIGLTYRSGGVADLVKRYQEPVTRQRAALAAMMTPAEAAATADRAAALVKAGAPEALAREAAELGALIPALDSADLAAGHGWPLDAAAALHRAIGALFDIDKLRANAGDIALGQHWERLALRRTLDQLARDQFAFANAAMAQIKPPSDAKAAQEAAKSWLESLGDTAAPTRATLGELSASGPWSFAKAVLAAASLHALVAAIARSE